MSGQQRRRIILTALTIFASTGLVSAQEWDRISKLSPGDHIQIVQTKEPIIDAVFRALSPEALTVERRNQVFSIPRDTIKQVLVKRKGSRWKAIGMGSAAGFGIGFGIGAASAGYLADQNSPSFGTRAQVGAGLGLLGAGVGAGLGALVGGSRNETVYRRK